MGVFASINNYFVMFATLYLSLIKGTELRVKSKQTAKATCTLASLTPEIFDYLKAKRPLLLKSDKDLGDAIYTFSGSKKDVQTTQGVIDNLKSIAGDDLLEHDFLSSEEISKRGYVIFSLCFVFYLSF